MTAQKLDTRESKINKNRSNSGEEKNPDQPYTTYSERINQKEIWDNDASDEVWREETRNTSKELYGQHHSGRGRRGLVGRASRLRTSRERHAPEHDKK